MVPGKGQKNMSALKASESTCAYNTCIHLEVGKHRKMKYNIEDSFVTFWQRIDV